MSRLVIVATLILLGLASAAFLVMGAFPPKPHRAPVEHVINNDRFHTP
jgi:hypothetical protein